MITNLLLYLYNHPIILIIFAVFFYIVSLLCIKYKRKRYSKISFDNTPESKESFLKYLDRYYIKNKFYTFSCVILYLFCQGGWILLYRLIFINHPVKTDAILFIDYGQISYSLYPILIMISFIGLAVITGILFKIMLDNLFSDELLKLHFFLVPYKYYYYSSYFKFTLFHFTFTFGKCYAFFINVSHFNEKYNPQSTDFYSILHEHRHIYENKYIFILSKKLVKLCKNNTLFHYIIIFITKLFGWLSNNMNLQGFAYYIPYIFFIIVISYNFTHPNSHYGKYLFFLAYILIQVLNYMKFQSKRHEVYDGLISRYFYKNSLNYKTQRILLKENIYKFGDDMYKGNENKQILQYMKDLSKYSFVNYVLNDCIYYLHRDIKNKEFTKEYRATHRRYYILSILLLGMYYIILNQSMYSINFQNKELSLLWIVIPIIILMIYTSINIYKSPKDNYDNELQQYVYKKHYKIIFWVLVILSLYIFWILIIKANLFLTTNGVLWDNLGITIIRNYTL